MTRLPLPPAEPHARRVTFDGDRRMIEGWVKHHLPFGNAETARTTIASDEQRRLLALVGRMFSDD